MAVDIISMLARVNHSLVTKTSDLQHEAGIARASFEIDFHEYQSPGLVVEGYVEASLAENAETWLWKWSATRAPDSWEIERRLECELGDRWEIVRELAPVVLRTGSALASELPELVEQLLALPPRHLH